MTYLERDFYFAGYKAFNAGESLDSCEFDTPEWVELWKKGWNAAKADAS